MFLLNILTLPSTQTGDNCAFELFSGYVGSADTGSEDLVRASRAALITFCETSLENAEMASAALLTVLKANITNDRVLVPTLEVIGFLFDAQIIQNCHVEYVALLCSIFSSPMRL